MTKIFGAFRFLAVLFVLVHGLALAGTAAADEVLAAEANQSVAPADWTPPQPTYAACRCFPNATYASSVIKTGMGESCAEAEADLASQLYGLGLCGGFFCDEYVELVGSCYMCTGSGCGGAWWKQDGKLRYKCEVCF
jgi:hypothetical protein